MERQLDQKGTRKDACLVRPVIAAMNTRNKPLENIWGRLLGYYTPYQLLRPPLVAL